MPKTLSLRLDDHVAALVSERARRRGVSVNQEINDAIVRDAVADVDGARQRATENAARYDTVMRRLG